MTREIAERLLLFLLPFAVYGLYLLLLRMRPPPNRPRTPWTALFIIGLSLFALSFVVWGFTDGTSTTGSVYVAPAWENGRIVPGHFAPVRKTP
jgi:uncharacterized membrane protein